MGRTHLGVRLVRLDLEVGQAIGVLGDDRVLADRAPVVRLHAGRELEDLAGAQSAIASVEAAAPLVRGRQQRRCCGTQTIKRRHRREQLQQSSEG